MDGTTLLDFVPNYNTQVSSRLYGSLIEPFRKVSLNDSGSSTSSGERERQIGAFRNPGFQRYRTLQRSNNHKSKKEPTSLYILCLKNNNNHFQRFNKWIKWAIFVRIDSVQIAINLLNHFNISIRVLYKNRANRKETKSHLILNKKIVKYSKPNVVILLTIL